MAVSNVLPVADSTLAYADTFSFEVTAGYASLQVKVTTMGGVLEAAYDDGVGSGYTVTVDDLGATHKFTVKRDAGWSISPTAVNVTEDGTTTSWTYTVFPTAEYPEGMQPYNAIGDGEAGEGVITFEGRGGNVVSVAGDYDSDEVTNASTVAGATVSDALETLDAAILVDSVHGRTGDVVAAVSDYDASQVDNDSAVAGATVKDALETLNTTRPTEDLVDLNNVLGTTITTQEDINTFTGSVSRVNGGGIITDDGDGTVTVGSGYGFIRATDSDTAVLHKVDWVSTPLTPTDNQLNFIYYEWNGGTPQMVITTAKRTDLNTNIYIGSVHRTGTFLHPTTHVTPSGNVSAKLTKRFNDTEGLTRASGSVTSEDSTRYVDITAGVWWHGLDEVNVPAMNTNAGGDTITTFYRDGLGGWTVTSGVTQIPNDNYDDGSGTLAPLTANRYGVYWLYIGVDNHIYMIYGRGDYTASQWADAQPPGDIPPHMQEQHSGLAARIVVQKTGTNFHDLTTPWDTLFSGSGVVDHGDLAGLSDDDHGQYARTDGTRAQDALFLTERADHVNTPATAKAELWAKNTALADPMWTDDLAIDWVLARSTNPPDTSIPVWNVSASGEYLENFSGLTYDTGTLLLGGTSATLSLQERSTGPAFLAGHGKLWVKNDTRLYFTDDLGVENKVAYVSDITAGNGDANMHVEYDSTTTAGTGGVGTVRFNNATVTSATEMYVDDQSPEAMGWRDLWMFQPGTSVVFAYADDPTKTLRVLCSFSTDVSTYTKHIISAPVASTNWTNPTDGQDLVIQSISVAYTAGSSNHGVIMEERASAPTNIVGSGQLWVEATPTQKLRWTNDAGTDLYIPVHNDTTPTDEELLCFDGTTGHMKSTVGMEWDVSADQLILRGTPYLTMQERTTPPGASSSYGKWYTMSEGTNTAMNNTSPWFTDGVGYDQRLGLHMVTLAGEVSPAVQNTWYSWASNGSPTSDISWTSSRGTGAAPTWVWNAIPWFITPGDVKIERVVGWFHNEGASTTLWDMELSSIAVKDADTALGTVDPHVDASIHGGFYVDNTKITLIDFPIADSTAYPTDNSHMCAWYLAFRDTTTGLTDLRFNVTVYWSTGSLDGWHNGSFVAGP